MSDTDTDTDDIADPATPAAILEQVQAETRDLSHLRDQCLVYVQEAMHGIDAQVRERISSLHTGSPLPEEAQIRAYSPDGYGVTLITRKATPGELIAALTKMQEWLKATGYKPAEVPF